MKMKPIEFAEKQLKNEEKIFNHLMSIYKMTGDESDLEKLKEQYKKVKKKKERLELVKNAPVPRIFEKMVLEIEQAEKKPRAVLNKECEIYFISKARQNECVIIENHRKAETATAIIDEIIESEFSARSKIRLIKMLLNGKISTLEIDALLTEIE